MKKNVFLFLLTLLPLAAIADKSGKCGDNLTWTYVDATRTLTISGEGDMRNFSDKDQRPWYNCYIEKVVIEKGVTGIGAYTFYKHNSLTSVTIPESVTSIEGYAFYECKSLTSVNISDLEAWCKITFAKNYWTDPQFSNPLFYAHHLYLNGEEIKDLVITEKMGRLYNIFAGIYLNSLTISESASGLSTDSFYGGRARYLYYHSKNAFYPGGLSFTEVILGEEVTTIGYRAFMNCKSLQSVSFGNSVTSIDYEAFSGCTGLTSISIPNSVTEIGDGAFQNCLNLASLTININTIGPELFKGCSQLKHVDFGKSVEKICARAFYNCDLQGICFPASLKEIDEDAFKGNRNLSQLEIHAVRPPACMGKIFEDNVYSNTVLRVPKNTLSLYSVATGWNFFYEIIDDIPLQIDYFHVDDEIPPKNLYNIDGQRISERDGCLKGIYIVDGKKVWFR